MGGGGSASWITRGSAGRGATRSGGRTLEREDTTLGLGLVTNVRVLLAHADHDTLVTGAADDGGEDLIEGDSEPSQSLGVRVGAFSTRAGPSIELCRAV